MNRDSDMWRRMLPRGGISQARWSMVILGIAGATAISSPLAAQYPSVPPPQPCRAHESLQLRTALAHVVSDPAGNSVGVVYFQNTAAKRVDDFLGDALSRRIVDRLRATGTLDVAETRKFGVEQYRSAAGIEAVGDWLHARYLVLGQVGRTGGDVSVRVRLVDAKSGAELWKLSRLTSEGDLPAVEAAVVSGVLGNIGFAAKDTPSAAVVGMRANAASYDHFLRGAYYHAQATPSGFRQAVVEYDSAVRLDSAYAPAAARLGMAYASELYWGWWDFREPQRQALIAQGLAAVDLALRLDSAQADAWAARGALLSYLDPRSFMGVRDAFDRASRLTSRMPDVYQWYGRIMMERGDDQTARLMLRRALDLAPRRASVLFDLAHLDYLQRNFADACAVLDSAVESDPLAAQPYALRALVRARRDDIRSAWADAETAGRLGWPEWGDAIGAVVDARARDTTSARVRTKRLLRAFGSRGTDPAQWAGPWIAIALTASGQQSKALDILEQSGPPGAPLWSALQLPDFAPIIKSPRFERLQRLSRPQ